MVRRNKVMLINYNFGWPTPFKYSVPCLPVAVLFGLLKAQIPGRIRACHPTHSTLKLKLDAVLEFLNVSFMHKLAISHIENP